VDFRLGSTSSDGAFYYPKEAATTKNPPVLTVVCSNANPDTLAPTAPTNLTGSAPNGGEVDLSWRPSNDNLAVVGYRIYRNGKPIDVVPGDAVSAIDATVASQTTYSYRVSAIDAANNESPMSNIFTTTTPK